MVKPFIYKIFSECKLKILQNVNKVLDIYIYISYNFFGESVLRAKFFQNIGEEKLFLL